MQRKASAVEGGLKDGKGSISTDSGVLKQTHTPTARALKTVLEPIRGVTRRRARPVIYDGSFRPVGARYDCQQA